ncbi:MAG: inner membrane CreD family protein [Rhodospirillaceae bacterium]|nr:inner membrane CreD family protein [Rhodospirillaceae bacterium]
MTQSDQPAQPVPPESKPKFWQSLTGHTMIIGALALLLLIPLGLVQSLVQDRAARLNGVQTEIGEMWGREQWVSNLTLVIPVRLTTPPTAADEIAEVVVPIFPQSADITAALRTEQRKRGLYAVPVYTSRIGMKALFRADEVARRLGPNAQALWGRAYLGVIVNDARRASADGWNAATAVDAGRMHDAILSSTGHFGAGRFIGRPLTEAEAASLSSDQAFTFEFELPGIRALHVSPGLSNTSITITGNWPSPSFGGSVLPTKRDVTDQGFSASWILTNTALEAESVTPGPARDQDKPFFHVSVQLNEPVSAYGKTERVANYGVLFIILTFTVYFLFEVIGCTAVHPMQYALIGCGLCLFYLLLLSTSEVAGFAIAYVLSAAAVVAQMALYTWSILGRAKGLVIGAVGATLYGLLYVLLILEGIPLLAGSWALFVILSAVMWLTRKLDWSRTLKPA